MPLIYHGVGDKNLRKETGMAQLTQELINLVEVALDAPLEQGDEGTIELIAKQIVDGPPEDELAQMKHLKIVLLVVARVNKIKEQFNTN